MPEKYVIEEYDLKILKLKLKNKTHREIANELQISERTVQRRLKILPKIWPNIRDFIFNINEDKELKASLLGEITSEEAPQVKWMKRQWEEGYHLGVAPRGWRKDSNGDLFRTEEANMIKRLFVRYDNGEHLTALHKDTGIRVSVISRILHNPAHKGWVCFKEKCHRGRHYPRRIVSEELWDRVQRKLRGTRQFGMRSFPYGYSYENNKVIEHREKLAEIDKMFKLGEQGKSFLEISNEMKWHPSLVSGRMRNPFYCGKKWENGRLVDEDLDYEPIVSPERWRKANSFERVKGDKGLRKYRDDIRRKNRNKVLSALDRNIWKTRKEIADETGLNKTVVRKYILSLLDEGFVEVIPPKPKRGGHHPGKYRRTF